MLKRISAGKYVSTTGRFMIFARDDSSGPRGGARRVWEVAYLAEGGGYVVDRAFLTLRAARRHVLERETTPARPREHSPDR